MRCLAVLTLCFALSACGNSREDQLATTLAEASATLALDASQAQLAVLISRVDAQRELARGDLSDFEAAVADDFLNSARLTYEAWSGGFGCYGTADGFITMEACTGGREQLLNLLTSVGVAEADAQGLVGDRYTMVRPLLGAMLAAIERKADRAAKAL